MEHNLKLPYGSIPSGPHEAKLVFYSKQSDDLLFDSQTTIEIYCRAGLRSVGLAWTLARNMFQKPFLIGQAAPEPYNAFVISIPTAKLRPGFYDLRVTLNSGDAQTIQGICTFGYKADHMPLRSTLPPDFQAFWNRSKEQIAATPLKANHGKMIHFNREQINAYNLVYAAIPADYDSAGHRCEEVELYHVDFAGANNMRVHGLLTKPIGNGPFPAMLVLPGAGFNARPAPLEHARHGYIALDIQVHGQPVDLPKYEEIPGYYRDQIYQPPEKYYFHRITQNCLQAVNYLVSRTDVDPLKITVVGGSQGGRMSIVVVALDHRIAAAVPAIANFGNYPYLEWARLSNTAVPPQDGMDCDLPPVLSDSPANRCLAYYDLMNFAPFIRCPVLMNAGLIDGASPPSTIYAIHQCMTTPNKKTIAMPGLAHDWSAEFDRRAWRWLDKVLNHPPLPLQGK